VPKAVYRSGCCDKHGATVGFDPGTSQSQTAVERLDHCDLRILGIIADSNVPSDTETVKTRFPFAQITTSQTYKTLKRIVVQRMKTLKSVFP